jgi:hypothetical protein
MSYGLVFGALFAVLLFVGFIGGLVWWVRRPISSRRQRNDGLPLFGHDRAVVYPRADDDENEDDRAPLIMAWAPDRAAQRNGAAAGNGMLHAAEPPPVRSVPRATRSPAPTWSAPTARTGYAPMPDASTPDASMPDAFMPDACMPEDTQFDGRSVRYSLPTDSTLPFLPGRLEIVGGPDVGREIRFVRTPGREVIDVTFGRNEGAPYRHVQLHDATVSRAHARMRFREGRWLLANRSVTNPVLYNGEKLASETDVALEDGDRIEMGEVVFRFHV